MKIMIKPIFIEKELIIDVYEESEMSEDVIEIVDFVEEIDRNNA